MLTCLAGEEICEATFSMRLLLSSDASQRRFFLSSSRQRYQFRMSTCDPRPSKYLPLTCQQSSYPKSWTQWTQWTQCRGEGFEPSRGPRKNCPPPASGVLTQSPGRSAGTVPAVCTWETSRGPRNYCPSPASRVLTRGPRPTISSLGHQQVDRPARITRIC